MRANRTLPPQLQKGQTAEQILADHAAVKETTVEHAKVKGGYRAWLQKPDGTILRTTEVHPTLEQALEYCV
jgi:hypothetical protein